MDIFHEDDGQPATRNRKGGEYEGVRQLKSQLYTMYKTAQGELGWDDPNNCPLEPKPIRGARDVEIADFRKQGVYTKVPRSEALRQKANKTNFAGLIRTKEIQSVRASVPVSWARNSVPMTILKTLLQHRLWKHCGSSYVGLRFMVTSILV